jgi:outer membrane protein TolC
VVGDLKSLAGQPVPKISKSTLNLIPSVRQAMEGSKAFDFRAAATLRSRWPTLDIVGGAALVYPKNFFEKEWGPAYQAGVVLRWRFWDGLMKNRQADEARATARKFRRLGKAARQQARQKYAEALAALKTADAELKAAEGSLKAAEVYFKAADTAVKGGLGRRLELADAQAAVLAAKTAIQKAYFDRAMARSQVLWVLGVARRSELRARRQP